MFQITLLAAFGALAVAGILIFALAVGGDTQSSVGAVRIWGTLDQAAFTAVIRQAAESNADLSQVSYEQKDAATFERDLTEALASGTGPDLFLLRSDYAIKDASKVIEIPFTSLSQTQFNNTFIEASAPFLGQSGTLGIPLIADPLVLYWNKDMLASAGFSQPPQYWDEFYRIAQKVSKKNDAGAIIKSAVAFGEYRNVPHAKDILSVLIMQAGGAIVLRDSTQRLVPALVPKSTGATRAAESALQFFTEFADPSKDDYSWNRGLPDAQQAFAAGDVGLYMGYASEKTLITRMNPNLNFATASMPQVRSAEGAVNVAHVYALAASRAGSNPTSAVRVAYLIGASAIAQPLSVAIGLPSARRDVVGQATAHDDDELFNKQAIIARAWLDPSPEETDDIFRDMIESVTSGSQLVAQAVQRADQQLGHLLSI